MHTKRPVIPAFERDDKKEGEEADKPPPPKPGHAPHVELLQKKDMNKEMEKWKRVTAIRQKEMAKNRENKESKDKENKDSKDNDKKG